MQLPCLVNQNIKNIMKQILYIGFLFITSLSFAQTQLWMDDFEATSGDWDLTLTTGQNDSEANIWNISDDEGGVAPPGCGAASNGNKTLYVGCQGAVCMGTGAAYFTGDNGAGSFPATTNIRAALTAPISTVGETQLEVVFDWIGVGQNGQDFAELEYSVDGGTAWNVIWTQSPGATCGAQGKWKEETVALPVAAENQADFRFAFTWTNDNDGAGSDPSFAANDLTLNANANTPSGPSADFTATSLNICEGDCVDFTDVSTGSNIASWDWTFDGADTPTSSTQDPTSVCWQAAGTYDVTLEVTDDNGTDDVTYQVEVTNCSAEPSADFTATNLNICERDCIDFTDVSTGTNIASWDWTFNGADTPSSSNQNPTSVCWQAAGTYDVTLEVTDDNGTDDVTYQVIVSNCTGVPPTAAFTSDTSVICAGDCIGFTDQSSGAPTSWNWTFDGGNPASSTEENPSTVCFDSSGTHNITLNVSNANGSDQVVSTINVLDLPTIQGFGDTLIDIGGAAALEAIPDMPGGVFWVPGEPIDCDSCLSVLATPVTTTVFYPSVIGANGCIGLDTVVVSVNFEEIVDVPSAFSPNDDGVNDFIQVLGIGLVNIDLKIYNRYGQLVFSSTDIDDTWDGTFNGEPLNQGVFVYTLEYDLINGASGERSGNITLIK